MISKETARKIFNCHGEIEKSNGLISAMKEAIKEEGTTDLKDNFGDRRGLQLGIPSGQSGHTLYNVPVEISIKVIEAHIEQKERQLKELMAIATIELKG